MSYCKGFADSDLSALRCYFDWTTPHPYVWYWEEKTAICPVSLQTSGILPERVLARIAIAWVVRTGRFRPTDGAGRHQPRDPPERALPMSETKLAELHSPDNRESRHRENVLRWQAA